MSDTPETDGAEIIFSPLEGDAWVPASISRKLERERDEARGDLEFWRGLYKVLEKIIEEAKVERDEWAAMCGRYKQERDEALMDRANGDIATMTINHYDRILRERDEAREQTKELIYIAERAIALAEIDFENDKFGVVSELRDGVERIKEGAK
jgi:hypothetical protein